MDIERKVDYYVTTIIWELLFNLEEEEDVICSDERDPLQSAKWEKY